MSTIIDSVTAYINNAPVEIQERLHSIRNFILEHAPKETTEIIAYKMPTYRYNGSLIYFAYFKNHISIFPCNETIEHFAAALKDYKTSKGTIQIQNNQAIPFDLLKQIIDLNVERLKDKKGPNWHNARGNWETVDTLMHELVKDLPLEKAFKWGSYIYTFQDKNVIGWGGFKDFFSLWFYQGVFLKDTAQHLISASEGKTKGLRQWRFKDATSLTEHSDIIVDYIMESIQAVKDGKKISPSTESEIVMDSLLVAHFENNPALKIAFDKFTKGRKKEFIQYINEAKQDVTKLKRIEKIHLLIESGMGLNDKYKR